MIRTGDEVRVTIPHESPALVEQFTATFEGIALATDLVTPIALVVMAGFHTRELPFTVLIEKVTNG